MPWLDLVLLILASFRLTHLVVFDKIAEPLRRPLTGLPFIGSVITCYWCAGIWVSGFLVLANALWPAPMRWLLLVLAVSGGQAILENWLPRD